MAISRFYLFIFLCFFTLVVERISFAQDACGVLLAINSHSACKKLDVVKDDLTNALYKDDKVVFSLAWDVMQTVKIELCLPYDLNNPSNTWAYFRIYPNNQALPLVLSDSLEPKNGLGDTLIDPFLERIGSAVPNLPTVMVKDGKLSPSTDDYKALYSGLLKAIEVTKACDPKAHQDKGLEENKEEDSQE